jgi:thiosulfate dehydrogenase (quinone) large subunit
MRDRFNLNDETIAYALLRLVLGTNLMMHGVSRMLMGPGEFAGKLVTQFAMTRLPEWMVWSFGVVLPGIEGLLGLLLLMGMRTKAALIAAGMLMATLTFGSSLVQDWTMVGTQLVYATVISALLFLRRFNGWSVDAWMGWN